MFSDKIWRYSKDTKKSVRCFFCVVSSLISNFHCAYTNIEVVHTELIKVVQTDYSAFKSSSKMIQEQVTVAVIIALISEKKKSRKNRKKEKSVWNLDLKEEKT